MRTRIWLIILLSFLSAKEIAAQDVMLKSNLLYWGTATPNAGIEVATGKRHSLNLAGGVQPWEYSDTRKLRHWLVQPEWRWWPCETFNGHFWGLHALGGQFNAGGIKLPLGLFPELENHRYQGWAAGGGVSWGYQWMLGRKWSMEFTLGIGYLYVDYKKYNCPGCGTPQKEGHRNYLGPTKAALNLIYVLK